MTTSFTQTTPLMRFITLFLLIIAVFMPMSLFAASIERRFKLKYAAAVMPIFVIAFPAFVLLSDATHHLSLNKQMSYACSFAASLPEAAIIGFAITGIMLSAFAIYLHNKSYHNTITPFSIKESIDDIPIGMCFAEMNGLPILVNRKMYDISTRLCGNYIQNTKDFWKAIKNPPNESGVRLRQNGKHPVLEFENGDIYTFSKTVLKSKNMNVYQILATDTMELYHYSERLLNENKTMQELNLRLKHYGDHVNEIIREEEILSMKLSIHNELGQTLLATRKLLLENEGNINSIIGRWHKCVAALKYGSDEEEIYKNNVMQSIINAANAVGISVYIQGDLPENNEISSLILFAARECITNAVKHAKADSLFIEISEGQVAVLVSLTNDGELPEGPITESGGLASLRKAVEESGGSMQIKIFPKFCLSLKLLKQSEDTIW